MKRLFATMTAALMVLAFAGSALAAPPATGKSSITPFGDSATQVSKTSVRIDTTSGSGGGAYIPGANSSFYGVRLSQVTALSNTVTGTITPIDPRWSIPIDENNDGYTEAFAFVSFDDCNDGLGLVDVIHDSTCTIYYGANVYPNWLTFATIDGTNFEIAAIDNYAFIIADLSGAPGVWTIGNMKVGKPGK